ncbi:MAG: hydroxymethylbilane synthase [Methanosarcinaceae archaeon]|nr:hydroxymethylbilane synthase [Methanosarcinaceae archaeon]
MIIGTRGSKLAITQANIVKELMEKEGVKSTIKTIQTQGDIITDKPLHQLQGVGVFVRELDAKLYANEIDIAVHSMKDIPSIRPDELSIAAVLVRDSPYDILLTHDNVSIDDLDDGSIIGTSSMRRRAQLLRHRPDLNIQDIRGNIDTRLNKLNQGLYDGIVIAKAGLERMGLNISGEVLSSDLFCPSPNQGTIVIATKFNSEYNFNLLKLNHMQTKIETEIERTLISLVESGCSIPIASFAKVEGDEIYVKAEVLSLDGADFVYVEDILSLENYQEEALYLAQEFVDVGGAELIKEEIRKCNISYE